MSFLHRTTLDHAAYTIALICPLEVEMSAARYMLDEEHPQLPPTPYDTNRYIFGQLSGHNVVIASLPEGSQGVAPAAAVAIHTLRTFPSIIMSLLLGIGGGVPSSDHDIRLGDVVVSAPTGTQSGVVEYDLGKLTATGFVRKGYLAPPAKDWLNMIKIMRSDHRARPNRVSEYLSRMIATFPRLRNEYKKPSLLEDVLFQPEYVHVTNEKICDRCDKRRIILRPDRDFPDEPVVHYGLIASGNQVIKDGVERDRLSSEVGGAICFEMEAAGMMNDFQAVVIRGISDYADSHKNDHWHAYAAAAAAGVAKELLSYTTPATRFESVMRPVRASRDNAYFLVPRKVNSNFTGRSALLEQIAASLYPKDYDNLLELLGYPQIYVLTGIGGVGKSEVCLKVASTMRNKFWAIFWVDVDDELSATRDFAIISNKLGLQDSSILNTRNALASLKDPWLLILDNADDPDQDLNCYIPPGSMGSILITSRVPEAQSYATVGHTALDGLPEGEALRLFSRSSGLDLNKPNERNSNDVQDLVVNLLNCHTLAIIQAGAYIRLGYSTLKNYVNLFHRSGHDEEVINRQMRALKHRSPQERSRYESVYKTFEISISFLEREDREENTDAICLLNLLACLSHTDLSTEVFKVAWEGHAHHQDEHTYRQTSDTEIWEHLSVWHQQHLPPFVAIQTRTWDPFRMQSAIHKLYSLALLNRTHNDDDEEFEVLSSHPLVHSWARIRQQKSVRDRSWMQAGSLIAHAWRRNSYRSCDSQISAHIESFLAYGLESSSSLGPRAEIAVTLLRCAFFLGRGGYFMPMNNLVREVFRRYQGDPYLPTRKLLQFHLLDVEYRSERYGPPVTINILRKIVVLLRDRAPHDETLLITQARLAFALYACLSQEAVSIMIDVVTLASQHRSVWDSDLLIWQINLAGLYADGCEFDEALSLLKKLQTIERQLFNKNESIQVAIFGLTCPDPYNEVKQLLRSLIVKKKWDGEEVVLPVEEKLSEERYRSRIWAGKHTSGSSAVEMWSERLALSSGSATYSRMEFYKHLKAGAFENAIRHVKTIKALCSTMPASSVWSIPSVNTEGPHLPGTSQHHQTSSLQQAQQSFLRDFDFPKLGTDLELDQLRAQYLALEYPAAEIFALNQKDPSLKAQHPYYKYSSQEKARFVMEGRWDMLECPRDLLGPNNQRPYGLVVLDRNMAPDRDTNYVYFRRQLYNLSRLPEWW